jgi:hypothetical protein
MNEPKVKNEVATKSENIVAVSKPMDLATVMADQGAGLSSHTMDDLAIPFIKILSSMSPQTKKNKTEYIEGATEGMIFNTVSQELTDGNKGISIIPCFFEPVLLEWTDRGQGSSAPVVHPVDSDILNHAVKDSEGKLRLPSGTYLERTHNHYCLLIDNEGFTSQVLLSMKVSQLSKSRKWNTVIMGAKVRNGDIVINPPSWYYIYHLQTKAESNDKGDWYGWNITRGEVVSASVYTEAKAFYDSIKRKEVKVNYTEDDGTEKKDSNPF